MKRTRIPNVDLTTKPFQDPRLKSHAEGGKTHLHAKKNSRAAASQKVKNASVCKECTRVWQSGQFPSGVAFQRKKICKKALPTKIHKRVHQSRLTRHLTRHEFSARASGGGRLITYNVPFGQQWRGPKPAAATTLASQQWSVSLQQHLVQVPPPQICVRESA